MGFSQSCLEAVQLAVNRDRLVETAIAQFIGKGQTGRAYPQNINLIYKVIHAIVETAPILLVSEENGDLEINS